MNNIQFKTNINCSGCVAKATPVLNETVGAGNWEVNTAVPTKTLTVKTGSADIARLVNALQQAGFKAEQLAQ